MILLSADSHGVGEIARLTLFDENSVLFWFDRYEAEGLDGLDASVALNLGGPQKQGMGAELADHGMVDHPRL